MDFFQQLAVFSERYFAQMPIDAPISPWGPDSYQGDGPIGAILHYTADDDFDRVVRWFMREKYKSGVSSNAVICDRILASTRSMMEGLPLIKELPVTMVQCRPPELPTWHATWASHHCYGIELINIGEVRKAPEGEGEGWVGWRPRDQSSPDWTLPWSHPLKQPVSGWGRWWEPYTAEQVVGCIAVLRHLRQRYEGLNSSWILGHECVQGDRTPGSGKHDKRDPGPLLPVHDIRRAVFEDTPTGFEAEWIKVFQSIPHFSDDNRDSVVRDWAASVAETYPEVPSLEVSWARFASALRGIIANKERPFGSVGKVALTLLGYHIPLPDSEMHDEDKKAVWLFQRMMGLKTDSIPGSRTRAMLLTRLEDRGMIVPSV